MVTILKKTQKTFTTLKNVEFEKKNRNTKYVPKSHNVKKHLPLVNGM
jgi:hypothetical protein